MRCVRGRMSVGGAENVDARREIARGEWHARESAEHMMRAARDVCATIRALFLLWRQE